MVGQESSTEQTAPAREGIEALQRWMAYIEEMANSEEFYMTLRVSRPGRGDRTFFHLVSVKVPHPTESVSWPQDCVLDKPVIKEEYFG